MGEIHICTSESAPLLPISMWPKWSQKGILTSVWKKEMTAYSSILAWRIPRTEEPGGYTHGVARVGQDLVTTPPLPLSGKGPQRQRKVLQEIMLIKMISFHQFISS